MCCTHAEPLPTSRLDFDWLTGFCGPHGRCQNLTGRCRGTGACLQKLGAGFVIQAANPDLVGEAAPYLGWQIFKGIACGRQYYLH